jgi:hypothetical protein
MIKFATPPFTGAEWFVQAMQLAGCGPRFSKNAYGLFKENGEVNCLKVSLVRNPLDWIEATWANLEGKLREPGTFNQHVRRFIDYPGRITNLYDRYKADLVLRVEDAPWCLIELLESCGIDKEHKELVEQTRPGTVRFRPDEWTPQLRQLVAEAEEDLMERYDYYV